MLKGILRWPRRQLGPLHLTLAASVPTSIINIHMLLPTIFRTEESLHRAWYKVARVPGNLEETGANRYCGSLGDRKIRLKRIPYLIISTAYCGIITEYSSYRRCCDEVWAGTYIKMTLLPGCPHQITALAPNDKLELKW